MYAPQMKSNTGQSSNMEETVWHPLQGTVEASKTSP